MTMLLTQKQVTDKYSISNTSLHRYVRKGLLTEHRTPGGHRRYDSAEIEIILGSLHKEPIVNEPMLAQ